MIKIVAFLPSAPPLMINEPHPSALPHDITEVLRQRQQSFPRFSNPKSVKYNTTTYVPRDTCTDIQRGGNTDKRSLPHLCTTCSAADNEAVFSYLNSSLFCFAVAMNQQDSLLSAFLSPTYFVFRCHSSFQVEKRLATDSKPEQWLSTQSQS